MGDIVIPGIFVSLCLRFDFLKSLNKKHLEALIRKEGEGEDVSTMRYLAKQALECSKSYFIAVNIGYLLAIICTVVVMLIFDHGQPALLYLVPGCLIAVLTTALIKGELSLMWEFTEDEFITPPDDDEDDDASKKPNKTVKAEWV